MPLGISDRNITMRKSAKKQQSKIQTIRRIVTSRNVSQGKGKQFLEQQSLVLPSMPEDLFLFLTTRIKKVAVWKNTLMSDLNTD